MRVFVLGLLSLLLSLLFHSSAFAAELELNLSQPLVDFIADALFCFVFHSSCGFITLSLRGAAFC